MRISSAWRSVTVLVLPSAGLAHPAAAVRSRNPVAADATEGAERSL